MATQASKISYLHTSAQGSMPMPSAGSSGAINIPDPSKAMPALAVSAVLPVLPEPLRLRHGPLIVTLQWWHDGTVRADLPCCALYGEGSNDTDALEDLGVTALEWARGIVALGGREKLGGPLRTQWDAFSALVDTDAL